MNDIHPNNRSNDHDELMQQLMELHYGLLDGDEETELRGRIDQEPEVAAAWAKTLALVGKIATAAQVDGRSEATEEAVKAATETANRTADDLNSAENGKLPTRPPVDLKPFYVRSFAGLAVAACLALMFAGYRYQEKKPKVPPPTLYVQAEPAPPASARSGREFLLKTSGFVGEASSRKTVVVPAAISFSVLSKGSILLSGWTQTDETGACRVAVPDDVIVPTDAKLRVVAQSIDGTQTTAEMSIPLEPTRCLTYLTVDRPVYRPGETVYFRSLTLNRRTLAANADVPVRFELSDPSGAIVGGTEIEGVTDRGVGNGSFELPSTAPGGIYTLIAKSLDGFFPEERREFQVRAYRVPRLKKELEFRSRSYGAGETVEADFSVRRAEGDILAGAAALVTAKVDDKVIHQERATTAPDGTLAISFSLPPIISEGTGTLSVMIDDGSVKETQVKTIPIHTGLVTIDFHPEGGYLVESLDNRVYFVARDSLGNPIELTGEVLNRLGEKVADLKTVRDGMGRFRFVPQYGERYQVKVTAPLDVTSSPELPAVVKDLPVIDTGDGVLDPGEPIDVTIRSKKIREVIVRAVCRGELVGAVEKTLRRGDNAIEIPLRTTADGVIRVTVLEGQSGAAMPLVERLVFRRNEKQLNVSLVPNSGDESTSVDQSPGEAMRLTLQITDENGKPKPAVLGVSVVDDASLSLDETERPTLRTHFLLTSEVQKPEDLEHANFYLNEGDEAAESLDLLLGTQGWRRFVSGSADQSDVDFRAQLTRLLEMDGLRENVAEVRYSNQPVYMSQWQTYHERATQVWEQLLWESKALLVIVALVWLVIVLARRKQVVAAATTLLLVIACSLTIGCGRQENQVIPPDSMEGDASEMGAAFQDGMMSEQPIDMEMSAEETMEAADDFAAGMPADESNEWNQIVKEGRELLGKLQQFKPGAEKPAQMKEEAMGGMGQGGGADFMDEMGMMGGMKMLDPEANRRAQFRERLMQFARNRGMDNSQLAEQLIRELRFPVRQYSHTHTRPEPEVRSDFAETLYWNPLLITDSSGKATIRFDLSDSITLFRVRVDGHASDGRIGSGDAEVVSRLPFQIEPKLPLEVTSGDRIDLPVAVVNASRDDVDVGLSLVADESLEAETSVATVSAIKTGERSRHYFPIVVGAGHAEQMANITIRGQSTSPSGTELKDNVRRQLKVSPSGYPASDSISGVVNQSAKVQLRIPAEIVADSLAVTLRAYPSRLADLMSGVEGILREPHGCFEQTSMTNYPNAMALRLMKENAMANPKVTRKALGMLDRGYVKLTSFECDKRGYEWFGSDPGHEALTAFGLMQFADMSHIMAIDSEMVTRTRTWLMSRRDGTGGFQRNPRHLHVWSVRQDIVNAYVMWALTEADVAAGQKGRLASEMAAELKQIQSVADKSDDAYLIALSAATLMNAGKSQAGVQLLDRLVELQNENGSLDGATTVTSSGGISRKVETTSLAILAWLKSDAHTEQARSATMWLLANRQGNAGFGSTQATVLALKALVSAGKLIGSKSGGTLAVQMDGETIGQISWNPGAANSTVEIKGLGAEIAKRLESAGQTQPVELTISAPGSKQLAYSIDVVYHAITPLSDKRCPVKLNTQFIGNEKRASMADGATSTVRARLKNLTESGQPMTVAIVGLPGGVEPKMAELDELRDAGKFDYYELRGRDVVFYWRTLEPGAEKEVDFTVTATVPGEYTGPASRAYLYYTAESKHWTSPLKADITRE